MRLKKVDIYGFKSFADKIGLLFYRGITGIVGPNGCGKSNIADAFRWALGTKSAKALRGNKSDDVIFAGTSQRKPLNYAEVTLTFEDAAPYEELAITRRLYRDGDTEYFINKNPARLKDVQAIYTDGGIGKNALMVFEQGKIDHIIQQMPHERRGIIENAAGISGALDNKKEAQAKLAPTNLNITRLKDIYQEVSKQVAASAKQAEEAKQYHCLKEEQEDIESGLLLARWQNAEQKARQSESKVQEAQEKLSAVQQQSEQWKGRLDQAKAGLSSSDRSLRSKSEELYKVRSQKEIQKRESAAAAEKKKELIQREQELKQESAELKVKLTKLAEEREEQAKLESSLQKQAALLEKDLRKETEAVQALELELNKLRERNLKAQQERIRHLNSESQAQSDLKQAQLQLFHLQERDEQILQKKRHLQKHLEELQKSIAEKKQLHEACLQELGQKKQEFQHLESCLKDFEAEALKAKKELDALAKEITEERARQKVLLRLREEMEGFSAASKRILKEAQNPSSPLFGKIRGLYELLPPIEQQQEAIGTALRHYAQTLVVQTSRDAELVEAFAHKHNLKEFSLLCRETVPEGTQSPEFGLEAGLEKVVLPQSDPLFRHLLRQAYCTKTTQQGVEFQQKNPQMEIHCDSGAWIDRFQVIFYPSQGEGQIFSRQAELQKLEKELEMQGKKFARLDANYKELQTRKQETHAAAAELDKAIRKDEMRQVELNFNLQRALSDCEKARQQQGQLDDEGNRAAEQIKKLQAALEEIIRKHESASKQARDAQQHCVDTDADLEQRMGVFKAKQRELRELDSSYQKMRGDLQKNAYAINLLETRSKEHNQLLQKMEAEIANCRNLQVQCEQNAFQFAEGLTQLEKNLEESMSACRMFEEELEKSRKQVSAIEKEGEALRQKTKEIENNSYQAGIQLAQISSTAKAIEAEYLNRFQLEIQDAIKYEPQLTCTIEQAEKRSRALKQQIEGMGNINLAAIEEHSQHLERYQYLHKQLEDLTLTQQELQKIIQQLEQECRKAFKATFEEVRANFIKNFRVLFNGGEADLQLTDSDDVLEAGIEIVAKPPGKQMRSISLLSGGEKCLTAMALLFAVFEVRPAPFCILDEIDAPLDDSNIERFVNVVKQFTDRCQFIIITHNKRTMAVADLLYGVSMEEKGVSKILSLQFSNETEAEPSLV